MHGEIQNVSHREKPISGKLKKNESKIQAEEQESLNRGMLAASLVFDASVLCL